MFTQGFPLTTNNIKISWQQNFPYILYPLFFSFLHHAQSCILLFTYTYFLRKQSLGWSSLFLTRNPKLETKDFVPENFSHFVFYLSCLVKTWHRSVFSLTGTGSIRWRDSPVSVLVVYRILGNGSQNRWKWSPIDSLSIEPLIQYENGLWSYE